MSYYQSLNGNKQKKIVFRKVMHAGCDNSMQYRCCLPKLSHPAQNSINLYAFAASRRFSIVFFTARKMFS